MVNDSLPYLVFICNLSKHGNCFQELTEYKGFSLYYLNGNFYSDNKRHAIRNYDPVCLPRLYRRRKKAW